MLHLDIRTLALVAMFSGLIFAATTLSTWRLSPQEPGLRHCAFGSVLFSFGMVEIATRPFFDTTLSIPLGNGLTLMGCAFVLSGFRALLGARAHRYEKWLPGVSFILAATVCAYYTTWVPSPSSRIVFMSLAVLTFHAGLAYTLCRQHDPRIARWRHGTIALQGVGIALYLARAWYVPDIPAIPDYTMTPSWLVIAPAFYAMGFNVWMAITLVLIVNTRLFLHMQQRIEETLAFNETLLAHSPQAIGVYRAEGPCIFVNDAYCRLVGHDRDTLLAQSFRTLESWKEAGLLGHCLTALVTNTMQRHDVHLATDNGAALWLDSRILPSYIKGETHLLVQLFDLTARKTVEDRLRQLAFHDPLTRLPNRRLLLEQLTKARQGSERRQSHAAILFIDLDRFKQLNDHHGHSVGDELLRETAHRLRRSLRDNDTVARFGGDEFVVILEDLGPDADAAHTFALKVCAQLRDALTRPYSLSSGIHHATATVGLRVFYGCGESPDQILKDADAAMYRIKPER